MGHMNTATYPSAAQAATLTGADLDHALVAVEQARREVEAAYVAVLDRAESTNRYTHDGHAGVRGWATALTNTGSVELHRRLQTMRALRDLPAAATALAAGDIGVDQVREIAKLHANPRTRDLTINSSSTLLDHARTTACVDFFVATAGASNPMAALPRTDAQRRFDALHSLFLGAVSAPPGSVAPEPVVNIIMSIQEYEDRLEQLATGTRPAPATVDDIDTRRCETDTGLPIDPTDAVTASLTGWFRRVIIDSAGVVIDLGRKRRFTGSARVAVILSRRRCL